MRRPSDGWRRRTAARISGSSSCARASVSTLYHCTAELLAKFTVAGFIPEFDDDGLHVARLVEGTRD